MRSSRAILGMAVVLLCLITVGFWWHMAWGIGFVLVLVIWLGSGAMPGVR